MIFADDSQRVAADEIPDLVAQQQNAKYCWLAEKSSKTYSEPAYSRLEITANLYQYS